MNRIPQILVSQLNNRSWHSGGKEYFLHVLRSRLKNCVYIFLKAHVEHFIGFIKDDFFKILKPESLSSHMIHDTARCADNNLRLAFQSHDLTVNRLSAVNSDNSYAFFIFGNIMQFLCNLYSQLSGWRQNKCLNMIG